MVVCQLAVKVVMERGVVNSLAVHISKSLLKEPALAKEGLGCLIVLLQSQKDGAVGPRWVKAYSQSSLVVKEAWHHLTCVRPQSRGPPLLRAVVGLHAAGHGDDSRCQSSAAVPAASADQQCVQRR